MPDDRPQPHNLDAERAVLAAALLEPQPCLDLAMERLGSAKVFYAPAHRLLFKCLQDLHSKNMGIDLISVADALRKSGELESIGGEAWLASLQNSIATTANLDAWCNLVRETSVLRGMITTCSEALAQCYEDSSEVGALIDQIEAKIYSVRYEHITPDIIELSKQVKDSFELLLKIYRKEHEAAIPSGFPNLDKLVLGLKPGEMFVLAARPSIGKTSFALNIVRNIALKKSEGKPPAVAFFSLEMTADQITRRLLCTESGVPETSFYDGSFRPGDTTKLTSAVDTLKKARIFIDPTAGLSISDLRAKARRLKAMHDIRVVVIDYLQLMKAGGRDSESRQQEVSQISSGIKSLAKDLNVPVLVLAQLNREIEKSTSTKARPKLSHLRESGAIEQDADIVSFLHRDRDTSKDNAPQAQRDGLDAVLIVEKNRNGRTGEVPLKFYPSTMEFRCITHKYGDGDIPPKLES
ncbi:MAG: replicative DNA helicase [Lentisphaerae bacterium GWF2_52_8]|nr:MAG: replicative DNA helicase [Lentisphaerae bacterium GWF2_52_8]